MNRDFSNLVAGNFYGPMSLSSERWRGYRASPRSGAAQSIADTVNNLKTR